MEDLNARQPEHMPEPTLDRVRELVKLLDHPELKYPAIQVTGTNGKTTATRLATSLACAHGLSAGAYVSPHVVSVTERLSLCDEPISEAEFAEEYERLLPYMELVGSRVGPVTYFEALTGLAFVWFADKPVGLGIFEVGMGGTWDATNLARGDVALVCPVGLDHIGILGETVEEIATEKAGIIKEGATAVLREQRPEALRVLEARASEVGASILLEGRDFELRTRVPAYGGQLLTVGGVYAEYTEAQLSLFGEQAARNASAAIVACEVLLGRALDQAAVREALAGASVPGRLEVVGRHPLLVLDGAHNPDAAGSLGSALAEAFRWNRLLVVAAMFDDKDVEGVLGVIGALADRGFAAGTGSPRAASPERVATALREAGIPDVETFETVAAAVAAARGQANEDDLILVTGSFFTGADARALLVGWGVRPGPFRQTRNGPDPDRAQEGPRT